MQQSIRSELDELKRRIRSQDVPAEARKWNEWDGADVMVLSQLDQVSKDWIGSQPFVVSAQRTEPRRRVVLTKFSRELSWLFCQLREIFSGRIDSISKYDFHGLLAQSAIDYLDRNQEAATLAGLLLEVVEQAEWWRSEERDGQSSAHFAKPTVGFEGWSWVCGRSATDAGSIPNQ